MGAFRLFAGPCDGSTAAAVRRELRQAGPALEGRSRLVEDLELAATELITNALRAGASRVCVEVSIAAAQLELRVSDDGLGVPQMRAPTSEAYAGRGLQIIAKLSDGWGYTPGPLGKTVWARFV